MGRSLLGSSVLGLVFACSGPKFEAGPDAGTGVTDEASNASDESVQSSNPPPGPEAGLADDAAGTESDAGGSSNTDDGDDAPPDDPTSDEANTDEPPGDDSVTDPDDPNSDEPSADDSSNADDTSDDATEPAQDDTSTADDSPTSDALDASTGADEPSSTDELDGGAPASSDTGSACSADTCLDGGGSSTSPDEPPEAAPPDECPDDLDQVLRGSCGCGFASDPLCEVLEEHIVHRYSFDGTGNTVTDSVGGADGEAVNVQLDGSGELELNGDSQHVVLPSGIASESNSATLEAWVIWHGGDNNQRVFNFGTPMSGEAPQEFVSFTPAGGNNSSMTVSFRTDGDNSATLRADWGLPTDSVQHITCVFDNEGSEVRLYVGSELVAISNTAVALEGLADGVNYLGRALYDAYPYFDGSLLEFRIYDIALDDEQISQSDALGDSATFSTAL